jgi:8-hydroxy-5-deazaflavin:NADPH oxidoreductase
MDIAIIGAGNVGKALAGSFKRAGHNVTIAAAHPEHAAAAAREIGATAAASNAEAIAGSAIVVLAVPESAHDAIVADIAEAARGKVVVDVSNRPTPNVAGAPTSVAEELQTRLPNSSVIKAFNTLFATRQADPESGGLKVDGFVAGDDEAAKKTVLAAVESVGFRPVDAGPLAAARTLEGMAWLNITRNMAGGTWQDAWILIGPDTDTATSRN